MNNTRYNINIKKLIHLLGDICLYSFILLTFYVFVFNYSTQFLKIRFIILLIGGIFGFLGMRKQDIKIIAIVFLVIVSYMIQQISRKAGIYGGDLFLYTLSYMGLAINMINHKQNKTMPVLIYYVCISLLIIKLVVFSTPIRQFMLDGSSYNYISVIALFPLCLYIITLAQNNKEIPLIAAILFFVVTVIAYGRGGILAGSTFLFLVILLKIRKVKSLILRIFILTIMAILFLIFLNSSIYYAVMSTVLKKFTLIGMNDTGRMEYWVQFLEAISSDLSDFILGPNPFYIRFDGNLHNSFLQAYAIFGIAVFLVVTLCMVSILVWLLKKKKYTLFIIAFTLFVRANSDKLFFQGFCEIYLWYFVFYAVENLPQQYNKKANIIHIK